MVYRFGLLQNRIDLGASEPIKLKDIQQEHEFKQRALLHQSTRKPKRDVAPKVKIEYSKNPDLKNLDSESIPPSLLVQAMQVLD